MYPPVKTRIEKEISFCLLAVKEKLEKELPEKPFFGVREVAEILGVSVRTVRRWISRGKIQAFKTEGSWKIARGELLDFIAERSNWMLP